MNSNTITLESEKTKTIQILFLSLVLFGFIYANYEYLHWKTFYQAFIGQIFLSIGLFFHKKKTRKDLILTSSEYFGLFYFILIASWVVASTIYFHKLGRYFHAPDFFRYFVIFIPLIFFREARKKTHEKSFLSSFFLIAILLLSSISFSYLFLEIPETAILLGLPLLVVSSRSVFDLNPSTKIFLFLAVIFLATHCFVGYNSFSTLVYLSIFFLGFVVLLYSEEVSVSYFVLIFILNLINIFIYQIYNLGGFSFFVKNPSPLLNSNRISGSNALYLVFIVSIWAKGVFHHKKVFFTWIIFLILFLVFNFFQYSRGGVVSILLGILFYFILIHFDKKRAYRFFYVLFLFSLVCLMLLPFWIQFLSQGMDINLEKWDHFSSGRIDLWTHFFRIFQEFELSQKVLGLGLGEHNFFLNYLQMNAGETTLNFATQADGTYIHTHNLLFTLLFYYGGIGFVLFLFSSGFLFWKIQKKVRVNRSIIPYAIAPVIFLAHNSFDSLLDTASIVVLLAYFGSFLLESWPRDLSPWERYLVWTMKIAITSFLLIRIFQWEDYHRKELIQKITWTESLDCKFAHVPEIEKIAIEYPLDPDLEFFHFPRQRKSQENLLYQYFYWKKYPTSENLNRMLSVWESCRQHHFRAYLCEYLSPKAEYGNIFQKWDSRFWIADKFKPCFGSNHENIEE
jgi:O-antigen ligase